MVENNTFFVDIFAKFKPKFISFHLESEKHPNRLAQKIRDYRDSSGKLFKIPLITQLNISEYLYRRSWFDYWVPSFY